MEWRKPMKLSGLRVLQTGIGALLLTIGALVQAEDPQYKAVGEEVTLVPQYTGSPSEINWKVNGDKLVDMEMNPLNIHFYRLQDRATIEKDGRLTITDLNKGDSALYKAEVLVTNIIQETNINLIVLDCPAKPTTTSKTIDEETIELNCESVTPSVKYEWWYKTNILSNQQSYNVFRFKEDVTLTCVVYNEECRINTTIPIPRLPDHGPPGGIIALIVILVLGLLFLIIYISVIYFSKYHGLSGGIIAFTVILFLVLLVLIIYISVIYFSEYYRLSGGIIALIVIFVLVLLFLIIYISVIYFSDHHKLSGGIIAFTVIFVLVLLVLLIISVIYFSDYHGLSGGLIAFTVIFVLGLLFLIIYISVIYFSDYHRPPGGIIALIVILFLVLPFFIYISVIYFSDHYGLSGGIIALIVIFVLGLLFFIIYISDRRRAVQVRRRLFCYKSNKTNGEQNEEETDERLIVLPGESEICADVSLKLFSVGEVRSMKLHKNGVMSVFAVVGPPGTIKSLCLTVKNVEDPAKYSGSYKVTNEEPRVKAPANIVRTKYGGVKLNVPNTRNVKALHLKEDGRIRYRLTVEGLKLQINNITLEPESVTINKLKPNDSGTYKVDIHSTDDRSTKNTFNLKVIQTLNKSQDKRSVKLMVKRKLTCDPPENGLPDGEPIGNITFHPINIANVASIAWKKDNEPVDTNDHRIKVGQQGDLVINDVILADAGSYTVHSEGQTLEQEFILVL